MGEREEDMSGKESGKKKGKGERGKGKGKGKSVRTPKSNRPSVPLTTQATRKSEWNKYINKIISIS